jgi:hypothetical protein
MRASLKKKNGISVKSVETPISEFQVSCPQDRNLVVLGAAISLSDAKTSLQSAATVKS